MTSAGVLPGVNIDGGSDSICLLLLSMLGSSISLLAIAFRGEAGDEGERY